MSEAGGPPEKKARVESKINYTWKDVHEDLEKDHIIGVHGACNAAYHGLAEIRASCDMSKFHKKRSQDEVYVDSLHYLMQQEETRRNWNRISTFDPLGMYATHPTMAATVSNLTVPELISDLPLKRCGTVVNPDGTIITTKVAIEYAWNLPFLSERLKMNEEEVRVKLDKYTHIRNLDDKSRRTFLPPVGGITIYFFGDVKKLADRTTEIAVRVHDECNGSDVFGTDICTCRPYLVFGIQGAVECAQRGGVGIIAYFRKEGRSLGEVTKFRVYNARKYQAGGDRPETYFQQTESIAGIRDARFQEMMPDVFHWLGIGRIDWLLSMSSDKYDAIVEAGVEVMQRVSIPDSYVPENAKVELTAKVSAGYHTESFESDKVICDLRGLTMIRQRCSQIYALAEQGRLKHFTLNMGQMKETADFVLKIMKENYPAGNIPYHSRWRHYPDGLLETITGSWKCKPKEKARRLIDLSFVSVLLDAGAGSGWKFIATSNGVERCYSRSEGLAVAALNMFSEGIFSSDPELPHRVNAAGLKKLTKSELSHGFQVTGANPLEGLEGRFKILHHLGSALSEHPEFFGDECARPGNLVDFVLSNVKDGTVSIQVLWRAIITGLESIWPNTLSGIRRGDIWVYNPLKKIGEPGSDLVPFHKLSQWLTLSLLEPIEALGVRFTDIHLLTGLAEYRNGGLFVDMGVLALKDPDSNRIQQDVGSELVVEWRAMTICLLDKLAEVIRTSYGKTVEEMPLTKVLQGGTWQAGRVVAAARRGKDAPPPLQIRSDGSVF
jgi:GTP cyclohydrolase II